MEGDKGALTDTLFRGLLGTALFAAAPYLSDVYRLWERRAGLQPSWPYRVPFEYPPVSALYLEPLGWLPSARWAVVVNGIAMTLAAAAITWLLLRVVGAERDGYPPDVRLWTASSALIFFLPIGWDALVTLVAVWGVIAVTSHRDSRAGAALGAGAAFKIFPGAIFLPLLPLLPSWRARRRVVVWGAAVVVPAYALYALLRPETWLLHVGFARARVTINAIWGPIQSGLRLVGIELSDQAINPLATVSLLIALVGLTLWVARRRPTVAEAALLAIVAFLVFNKVFNPQYLLWILPLMALVRVPRLVAQVLVFAALLQLATVYLPIPAFLATLALVVRTLAFAVLVLIVMRRPAVQRPSRVGVQPSGT